MTTLADDLAALAHEHADADVRHAAVRCVVDWAGCAIAGSASQAVQAVATVIALGSEGECAIFGTGLRGFARDAALVNGVAGHVLDFDDENAAFIGHPGAVVIPAVLALAERGVLEGQHVLDSVAAGYQAAALLGIAANPRHYETGWHATATLGTIASAIASSRALRLAPPQTGAAISVACTQASGLRAVFGSPLKSIQVGAASSAGVLSALLASQGIDAPAGALSAYITATSGQPDVPTGTARPAILDTIVKRHAACGAAQCLIEAVASAVRCHDIDPASIRVMRAHLSPASISTAGIDIPQSPIEAQFSLRHLAALAAYRYPITPDSLTSEPQGLDRLRQRTVIMADASLPATEHGAWVEIDVADGKQIRKRVGAAPGGPDAPASDEQLSDKFLTLVQPVLGQGRARSLLHLLWGLAAPTGPARLFAFLQSAGGS